MNKETLITELKAVKNRTKNDSYKTFEININALVSDVLDTIKEMDKEHEKTEKALELACKTLVNTYRDEDKEHVPNEKQWKEYFMSEVKK